MQDFERAPNYLHFLIFIQALILNGKAKYGKYNNKIIELGQDASNYFVAGRDEGQVPFIGIQESISWMIDLEWTRVCIAVKSEEPRIYMVSENEEGEINFVLGMKIKKKRMIVLFDSKNESLENAECNIKLVRRTKKGVEASFNNMNESQIKIELISDVYDIINKEEEDPFVMDEDIQFIKKRV
tara:strand:+ start:80 stop:631 length:552 start_codon:yes stop_codon:yes gene_type:complete